MNPISPRQARDNLERRIEQFANASAYAKHVGISRSHLSRVRSAAKPIDGLVMADLGLRFVIGYEYVK